MWIKILCFFCFKRPGGPRLSAKEQRKKWLRLVAVMSLKQYGTRFIANFFYAYLISETLYSMKEIWGEFKEYSDCNNEYTGNLTRAVSEQYSEASDRMAEAMMATSECLAGSLDVQIMGRRIGLGSLPGGALGGLFGWFTPGAGAIPSANLSLQSSSDKVMQRVANDLDRFSSIAFWVRLAGFIMSFVTIFIILAKATYYTYYHIQWKPGTVGLMIRVVEGLRVIAIYAILRSTIYFQTYITERACEVNVNNTVIDTPFCEVVGEECEFQCTTYQQNFSSPCAECEIEYTPPWKDPWKMANYFGVAYLVFIAIVIIVELREARSQGSELRLAQERAEEEEERRHQRKLEKKRRKAQELAEASVYVPPTSHQKESSKTKHRDDDEDKPRKHKSKHKSKHKHGHHRHRKEESNIDGETLV